MFVNTSSTASCDIQFSDQDPPDPGGRGVQGMVLRHLVGLYCGFDSWRGHGCVSVVSVVLSGTGPRVGLITRPEESYRLCCV